MLYILKKEIGHERPKDKRTANKKQRKKRDNTHPLSPPTPWYEPTTPHLATQKFLVDQIIFFSGCSLQVVVFIECCNHLISQSFTALNILKLFEIFQTDIGQPL